MDAATKQFLEQMQATLVDSITSWRNASIARHEVLVQKLELQASTPVVTTDGVVGPVLASSGTAELVTAPVVATDASSSTAKDLEVLQVALDAPQVCIEMVPVTCSMACPTQVVTTTDVDPKAGVQELDALSANTTPVTTEVDHGVVHIVSSDLTAPTLTKCSAKCSRRDTNLPRYGFHPAATSRPPDALACTGGVSPPRRQHLTAPIPKPPWLLPVHELRTTTILSCVSGSSRSSASPSPTAPTQCSMYCSTRYSTPSPMASLQPMQVHVPEELVIRPTPWPPPKICPIRFLYRCIFNGSQIELKPWPGEQQYQCSGGVFFRLPPLQIWENSSRDELQEFFDHAASFDFQQYNSKGLRGTTLAATKSQMLPLLGNISSPVNCFIAKDQCNAWALCISVTSTDSQCVLAIVSPHEYYLRVHYCHGNSFEGCSSACYATTILLLSWNYSPLNLSVWYAALHCASTSFMQICTLVYYGNQCKAWGIISGAFLKCKHCICCPGADLLSASGLLMDHPSIKMQSYEICLHAWAGTLVWHVGLINLSVFYQNFTDMAHDSTWDFTMQLKMIWDPGIGFELWSHFGTMIMLIRSSQFQWSSRRLACAVGIWLVTWIVDGLDFSTYCGQAPLQGGRNVLRADFSNQVHASHDYYIAFVNRILVGYDYYFNTVCSIIIYYHEDFHSDSRKAKESHMPWDPGKISLSISSKAAWGQAKFQGGRDVRTLLTILLLGWRQGLSMKGPAQLTASWGASPTSSQGVATRRSSE